MRKLRLLKIHVPVEKPYPVLSENCGGIESEIIG
jgi:hypothetical protein